MTERTNPPRDPETDRQIADVTSFFDDLETPASTTNGSARALSSDPTRDRDEATYDLDGEAPEAPRSTPAYDVLADDSLEKRSSDSTGSDEIAAVATPTRRRRRDASEWPTGARPEPEVEEEADPDRPRSKEGRSFPRETPTVSQTWTRGAEWGPQIIRIASVLALGGLVAMVCSQLGLWLLWALVTSSSIVLAVLLSYPLMITLERPIRITPEQAVRIFFESAEHRLPHFRRMWLLLSDRGRVSEHFSDFASFQTYWKDRITRLRAGRLDGRIPLVLKVRDYTSKRSDDKEQAEAQFTLVVSGRGWDKGAEPLAVIPMTLHLVRGPDRSFYLEDGTVPETHEPSRELSDTWD